MDISSKNSSGHSNLADDQISDYTTSNFNVPLQIAMMLLLQNEKRYRWLFFDFIIKYVVLVYKIMILLSFGLRGE
jgi:hypothetical protein